jgi:hypothetical protein
LQLDPTDSIVVAGEDKPSGVLQPTHASGIGDNAAPGPNRPVRTEAPGGNSVLKASATTGVLPASAVSVCAPALKQPGAQPLIPLPSREAAQKGVAAPVESAAKVSLTVGTTASIPPSSKPGPKELVPAKAGAAGPQVPIGVLPAPHSVSAVPEGTARHVAGVPRSLLPATPRSAAKVVAATETRGSNRVITEGTNPSHFNTNLHPGTPASTRFSIGEFATIGVLCPLLVWLLAYAIVHYGSLAEAMFTSH